MPSLGWTITLRTPEGTPAPDVTALPAVLSGVFGTDISHVTLAGPQSVDDGDEVEDNQA